jgi:hypothetical protein
MLAAWLQRLDLLAGGFVDTVVATVPPGSSWNAYTFSVTGTGGQDRLTFREVAGRGADGLGALYNDVRLVAGPTAGSSAALLSSAPFKWCVDFGPGLGAVMPNADPSANLAQTLAKSH